MKRFIISVVVLFILSMGIGFLVHAMVLGDEYARLGALFRSPADSEKYFPFMVLAHVFIAIALTWIYRQGKEEKPFFAQGLRFGAAVALLTAIPTYLIYYSVQPMPGDVVVKQIVLDTIGLLIMGVVVAFINK